MVCVIKQQIVRFISHHLTIKMLQEKIKEMLSELTWKDAELMHKTRNATAHIGSF